MKWTTYNVNKVSYIYKGPKVLQKYFPLWEYGDRWERVKNASKLFSISFLLIVTNMTPQL